MAIGSNRLVVGAHYGVRDWLVQRVTAVILAVYTVVLVVALSFATEPGYDGWARLFAPTWMKTLTLIALASLCYHAWIGVRDIWMDYVKPTGVRLALHVLTVVWLLACAVWFVQILWRI
jgi:succinate dehydrogenase / fumarate reductase membrane anchor subunit